MVDMPNELKLALEYAEDFATAHCIAQDAEAVLIYRDTAGNEFRRAIGPKGSRDIPMGYEDATVLARLRSQTIVDDQALLTLDAILAEAAANGDRVILI